MPKWKCSVCGYIHSGDRPPLKCPVCGADQSRFILLDEENLAPSYKTPAPNGESTSAAQQQTVKPQKWRCTVCGYIHQGSEPPQNCPVCGSDRRKFTVMEAPAGIAPTPSEDRRFITNQDKPFHQKLSLGGQSLNQIAARAQVLTRLHGHPIAVHIPNGVLPLTVLFSLLAIVFQYESLAIAAKCNAIFVCLFMPVVLVSGLIDWYNRFEARITHVFSIKMVCGALVSLLTLIIALWWVIHPDLYLADGGTTALFVFLNILDLTAAAVAGFYGGKLVFNA